VANEYENADKMKNNHGKVLIFQKKLVPLHPFSGMRDSDESSSFFIFQQKGKK